MAQQPSPPPPGTSPPPAAPQQNGMAIAAMVTGIVSLVFFWIFFLGIPAGIVGVVLGIVGVNKSKEMNGVGRGMAVAGIVTGAIGAAVSLILVIVALVVGNEAEQQFEDLEDLFGAARAAAMLPLLLRRRPA